MVTDEDKVFKALADASRRQLLDRLRKKNGLTLGDLCEGHDMSRQAVTKHLALLEAANLVVTQWRGARKAALSQPGADPRHLRALDRQFRERAASGAP